LCTRMWTFRATLVRFGELFQKCQSVY
jgi:hypothetical protein